MIPSGYHYYLEASLRFLRALRDWLLPCPCRGCGEPGPDLVCPGCAARLDPGPVRLPPGTDALLTLGEYREPWRALVLCLKFHGRLEMAHWFGLALGRRLREARLAPPDLLLPIPLSPRRLRERSHNQSLEIARTLGGELGRPVAADLLVKLRDTAPQLGLGEAQRRRNLMRAFAVRSGGLSGAGQGGVEGLRVGVVDDVRTSDAMLEEGARALRAVGVACITNFALLGKA
ncbi:MAG: ComF family protein [Candidatus Protistobacter heckmanni]|nr:ComF family protein [Candidatus Protistobacter heckmanni]